MVEVFISDAQQWFTKNLDSWLMQNCCISKELYTSTKCEENSPGKVEFSVFHGHRQQVHNPEQMIE